MAGSQIEKHSRTWIGGDAIESADLELLAGSRMGPPQIARLLEIQSAIL
jgi:hypothetical protein